MAGFRRLPAIYRKTYLLTRSSRMTSRYLRPEAVLKITLVGCFDPSPLGQATEGSDAGGTLGAEKNSFARPTRGISASISSSLTLNAVPLLSRIARSIKKSATACGTRRPDATVSACGQGSAVSLPSLNALTMGAQPLACTETMRGRLFQASPSLPFRQMPSTCR